MSDRTQDEVIRSVCELLKPECQYLFSGRETCTYRKCVAEDERRSMIWPQRFIGCRPYRAILALRRIIGEDGPRAPKLDVEASAPRTQGPPEGCSRITEGSNVEASVLLGLDPTASTDPVDVK